MAIAVSRKGVSAGSQRLPRAVQASLNVLFALILVFLFLLACGSLPNPWYHVLYVASGSMAPAIRPGDLIVITPPAANPQPGTILTLQVGGQLVTHRLVSVQPDGAVVTRGDANPAPDDWGAASVQVRGVYRLRVPYLGYLVRVPSDLLGITQTGAWFTDQGELKGSLSIGAWPSPTPTLTPRGTSLSAELISISGYAEDVQPSTGVRYRVCLTNTGAYPTQGLAVQQIVQYKPEKGSSNPKTGGSEGGQGNWQNLSLTPTWIDPNTAPTLAPNDRFCYDGQVAFTPPSGKNSYRLVLDVTIANHAGHLPGDAKCQGTKLCPFGPQVAAPFSLPELAAPAPEPPVNAPVQAPLVPAVPVEPTAPPASPTPGAPTETALPAEPSPEPSLEPSPAPSLSPTQTLSPVPTEAAPTPTAPAAPTAQPTEPPALSPTPETPEPSPTLEPSATPLPSETAAQPPTVTEPSPPAMGQD